MSLQLFVFFASLSLLAFGGGSAVIPELQRQTVEVHGWLTERQFVDFYAITQVTPGPGMMVVTLIGYQVGGVSGALLAMLGMFGPTGLLMFAARRAWLRLTRSRWGDWLKQAARPLATGTMLASATLVALGSNRDLPDWVTTIVAALLIGSRRASILQVMVAAGLSGWMLSLWR